MEVASFYFRHAAQSKRVFSSQVIVMSNDPADRDLAILVRHLTDSGRHQKAQRVSHRLGDGSEMGGLLDITGLTIV